MKPSRRVKLPIISPFAKSCSRRHFQQERSGCPQHERCAEHPSHWTYHRVLCLTQAVPWSVYLAQARGDPCSRLCKRDSQADRRYPMFVSTKKSRVSRRHVPSILQWLQNDHYKRDMQNNCSMTSPYRSLHALDILDFRGLTMTGLLNCSRRLCWCTDYKWETGGAIPESRLMNSLLRSTCWLGRYATCFCPLKFMRNKKAFFICLF